MRHQQTKKTAYTTCSPHADAHINQKSIAVAALPYSFNSRQDTFMQLDTLFISRNSASKGQHFINKSISADQQKAAAIRKEDAHLRVSLSCCSSCS